jgi:integrase
MGSIYTRGAVYWIKYYRNGKPYRESTKSTKESDARRLLKKREGEISEGKLPGIYFDRVKFDDLANALLGDYRRNGKDIVRCGLNVDHLRHEFGGIRATDITTPRIEQYIEWRRAWTCLECKENFAPKGTCPKCESQKVEPGATNGTINRELAALKRMFNLGAQMTPPIVDRVPHIPMLKENNIRKGFFEYGDFLAYRRDLPQHLQGLATFAYRVGWRVGEICALTWAQVDRQQGIVRLEPGTTKNDEGRTIYLDDELRAVFEEEWTRRKGLGTALPWVFLNEDGTDRVKRVRQGAQNGLQEGGPSG